MSLTPIKLFIAALAVAPQIVLAQAVDLPKLDFNRYFPHAIWITSAKTTQLTPANVSYRIIAVRDAAEKTVHVSLVRMEGKSTAVALAQRRDDLQSFEQSVPPLAESLGQAMGVSLRRIPLEAARTQSELEKILDREGHPGVFNR